jgi:hypothetical protein
MFLGPCVLRRSARHYLRSTLPAMMLAAQLMQTAMFSIR